MDISHQIHTSAEVQRSSTPAAGVSGLHGPTESRTSIPHVDKKTQEIADAHSDPKTIAESSENSPKRRLTLAFSMPVFNALEEEVDKRGSTYTAVIVAALRLFISGERRPRLPAPQEEIFRAIGRLVEIVVYLENRLDRVEQKLISSVASDREKLSLDLEIAALRNELRALRRQLSTHLGALSRTAREAFGNEGGCDDRAR